VVVEKTKGEGGEEKSDNKKKNKKRERGIAL
jgi:hypothetical protein